MDTESLASAHDPDIPFRATSTHHHATWAKTFHSHPELYIRPHSLAEIQKAVHLARKCRRRIAVVGCGHSPSILTLTSSWMMNLDGYGRVVDVDRAKKRMTVQGGIRLRDLNLEAKKYGWVMPNLGSIDEQSIVGAIATGTHGSSLKHGLLSEGVKALRVVLGDGRAVRCSADSNPELFKAALLSLGSLGIIVEVDFQMIDFCNIEWEQRLEPLSHILEHWNTDLWSHREYVRVWWLPYMKRAIVWSADRTDKPLRPPQANFYGGSVGFHTYHILLWLSNYVPRLLPTIEWFVFGMQYGFKTGPSSKTDAVEELRTGLLMNCLFSQFVNEWAVPLEKGPEILERLSAWINGDQKASRIPIIKPKGLYVHAPIEVRVSDTSTAEPRPYLDWTEPNGPTLFLNATLYRPYGQDPPCRQEYYEAFEWLMKEFGGRPHWAKNFSTVTNEEIQGMHGDQMKEFVKIRNEADPDGMFVGQWHRQYILDSSTPAMPLEEREVSRSLRNLSGLSGKGMDWRGELSNATSGRNLAEKEGKSPDSARSRFSDESYDVMHGAELEASRLVERADSADPGNHWRKETHGSEVQSVTGTQVFNKM